MFAQIKEKPLILSKLKQQTRIHHDRLEQRLDLPQALASMEQYVALLQRFLGFYGPAENKIGAVTEWEATGLNFEERRKAPLLERDLRILAAADAPADGLICPDLPALDSLPSAMGGMYVMEGATLGGQIISRHIQTVLGVGPESGGAFFHSYGNRIGPMWKSFGDWIMANATPAMEPVIIRAACETFIKIEQWLVGGKNP